MAVWKKVIQMRREDRLKALAEKVKEGTVLKRKRGRGKDPHANWHRNHEQRSETIEYRNL